LLSSFYLIELSQQGTVGMNGFVNRLPETAHHHGFGPFGVIHGGAVAISSLSELTLWQGWRMATIPAHSDVDYVTLFVRERQALLDLASPGFGLPSR
jgi:hypothetical protein